MEAEEEEKVTEKITLRRGGNYTTQDLATALSGVQKGEQYAVVSLMTNIPFRTLFKKAKDQREGKSLAWRTKPALHPELEADLVEWVAAMQRVGVPVGPSGILTKANEIYLAMQPMPTRHTAPPKPLTTGWYRRFIGRHPILTPRITLQIPRVRIRVDAKSARGLFYTMARLVIEHNLDKSRIINMDGTSFMPKAFSRKVVALKGSSNVWTQ
ncbi:hypothetical protein PI124_g16131 [Phytophthora idaei]|nr:hypothetical protein PI125_g16511 [Phytophthora idaei]KAG3142034.1 hypothetical protein PI126_g15234 [Phytophthora idaei]KAG3238921.1 hypothetical protein PI124_g16131 [Phytophthora idaei]